MTPAHHISIHAPRAGGDDRGGAGKRLYERFQSTPPVRGATLTAFGRNVARDDFNPRPPCGGRPRPSVGKTSLAIFQSTPPVRGATAIFAIIQNDRRISIHAPRAGGDPVDAVEQLRKLGISIHAPRAGGDGSVDLANKAAKKFQSTPPVRGATWCSRRRHIRQRISIHAPRAGGVD